MADQLIVDGVSLALAPDAPSTLEEAVGRAAVRRFFPGGPAVYALSLFPTAEPVDGVQSAAGDLVMAYRPRSGFSRTSRATVHVPGAAEALLLDFEWKDSDGVPMHSLALIAATSEHTMVLHGTLPVLHGPEALAAMEATILATSMQNEGVGR